MTPNLNGLKQQRFISCSRCISIEGQQGSLLHVVLSLGPRMIEAPPSGTSLWEGKRERGELCRMFKDSPGNNVFPWQRKAYALSLSEPVEDNSPTCPGGEKLKSL